MGDNTSARKLRRWLSPLQPLPLLYGFLFIITKEFLYKMEFRSGTTELIGHHGTVMVDTLLLSHIVQTGLSEYFFLQSTINEKS